MFLRARRVVLRAVREFRQNNEAKILLTTLRLSVKVLHISAALANNLASKLEQQLPTKLIEYNPTKEITMNTSTATQNTTPTNVAAAFHAAVGAQEPNTHIPAPAQKKGLTLSELKLPETPAVVFRKDYTGNNFVFFADTQNKEANTITAYDVSKGAKQGLITVPHAFYKTTLKLEDEQDIVAVSQKLSRDLGLKQLHMRQRLYKDTVLQKDVEGKVDAPDVAAIKTQLKEMVQNFADMMMQKIDEAL